MRTGRFRFRNGMFGNQILEVEVNQGYYAGGPSFSYSRLEWQKGTASDAADLIDKLAGRLPVAPPEPKATWKSGYGPTSCPIDVIKATGQWRCKTCDKRWPPGVIEDTTCGMKMEGCA